MHYAESQKSWMEESGREMEEKGAINHDINPESKKRPKFLVHSSIPFHYEKHQANARPTEEGEGGLDVARGEHDLHYIFPQRTSQLG